MLQLLDIAIRRPRVPVRNIPDSIASATDGLTPSSAMDTFASTTTASEMTIIMTVCAVFVLLAAIFILASKVRRQKMA